MKTNLFINRNYALFWVGQTISYIGDFVFNTTLILWITTDIARGQSWAPLAISGVALAETLPTLLVGPISGVFVDRREKRRTMLEMDALRAILIALLLLTTGLVPLPFLGNSHLSIYWKLASIYTIVGIVTGCSTVFKQARLALIGDIVPEPQQAHAIGLSQAAFNLALILGPTLAAPLYFSFGTQWAIMLDALSFGISFLCIFMVQMPKATVSITPGQEGHYFRELGEALRFFKGNSVLVVLIIGGILFNLGAGASDAFYLVFVMQNLHTPASLVGLFGATYGAAVIIGSIVIAMFARSIGEDKLLGFSLAVWGVAMLMFARMTSYIPGLFLFFVMGFANAGINVTVGPLELRVTPRELIGRVQAVFMPILLASSMLSAALAGYLASAVLSGFHAKIGGMMFSSLDTIFTGTGLLAIIAGGYTWFALRRSMLVPTVSSQKARITYLR